MKKGTLHVAVAAAALLALGATSAKAESPVVGPTSNTVDIRVVNNHASAVRVYVRDAQGRMHRLGKVANSDFKVLEIPGEITAKGDVEIRVVPDEPVWSLLGGADGIRTNRIELKLGDAVNMFVETDLLSSQVEIARS